MSNAITTSKKVELSLRDEGRKKTWLAEQLEISRPTLDSRLKGNAFSIGEIIKLKRLFNW